MGAGDRRLRNKGQGIADRGTGVRVTGGQRAEDKGEGGRRKRGDYRAEELGCWGQGNRVRE
jgi:hypothetical protein